MGKTFAQQQAGRRRRPADSAVLRENDDSAALSGRRRFQCIHPFLYFDVSADQDSPFHGFTDTFVVPYNAWAWMRTQFGP